MPKKTKMEAFNVVELSIEGVRVPLSLPDGAPTEEFFIVHGADTKEFRALKAKADRKALDAIKALGNKKPEEMAKIQEEVKTELVASLVKDWSFEQECTHANVVVFLQTAPQIQTQVDMFAGDRSNFFTKPPKD